MYVYSQGFNHDLAQHPILANVTLCTQNGHVGKCLTKSIVIFSPLLTQVGINISYENISNCPGNIYVLKFQVMNTGNIPWESIRLSVSDLDLNSAVSADSEGFAIYSGCNANNNETLTPGERVVTGATGLPADPTGHICMAYFKLCSQGNLGRTCLEKTINFIP